MLRIYENILSDCSGNWVSLCLHVKFGFLCRFSYTVPLQKKSVKILSIFLGGHNGDNARLDCPQLHQLGKFKFQNITFVKMFKSQYVPKSFVIKYNLPKYLFNLNLICQNIYDSIFFKLSDQRRQKIQDSRTNQFFSAASLKKGTF